MELTETKPTVSTYWLLRIVIGSLIGAILIGVLFAVVSQFLDLIILYPLLMGAFGGMFVAFGAERLQVKSRLLMVVLGVLLGLLIYGTYRYTDYLLFVRKLNDDSAKPISVTFDEYLRLTAAFGFSIARVAESDANGLELKDAGVWLFWGLELLCATVGGGYFALRLRERVKVLFPAKTNAT
jgi:hypothetical protein